MVCGGTGWYGVVRGSTEWYGVVRSGMWLLVAVEDGTG